LLSVVVLFVIYFILILAQVTTYIQRENQPLEAFVAVLISAFIVLLDLAASRCINFFVSFEKHFSSIGQNWKRIVYLAIFIVANSLAAILAYCFSQPLSDKSIAPDLYSKISFFFSGIDAWSNATYERSYVEWQQSCSKAVYSSPQDVIARLSTLSNINVPQTIGYWYYFTSKTIDGFAVPAFSHVMGNQSVVSDFIRVTSSDFYQIGCNSGKPMSCRPSADYYSFNDSCAFISNMSLAAVESKSKVLFNAAFYDLPWPESPSINGSSLRLFRMSSFASESSLYGFLFAFIFFKALSMVFYYIYNDFVGILSRRLIQPLLKRYGSKPKVSLQLNYNLNSQHI
jgi:hypothetical protein